MSLAKDPADIFRQEADELFQQLEQALLDLEDRPGDADLVDTAFRALHTIKGSGSVFGFDALAAFTHQVESVFHKVRAGELAATPEMIGVTLAARDHMRRLLDGTADGDGQGILDALGRAATGKGPKAPGAAKTTTYRVAFTPPPDSDPAPLVEEVLALGEGQANFEDGRWTITLATPCPATDIETVFLFISEGIGLSIEPVAAPAPAAPRSPPAMAKPVLAADAVVKVAAGRIDGLMDQVGEMVIAEARLRQFSLALDNPELLAIAEEIERLTAGLRETSMSIRMVPIGSLFGRFRRVVRDLSHELGKDVRLLTQGEDTELDKAMVEALHDPLIHLIRNAMDHGIEEAPVRQSAGKAAEGTLVLSAEHRGAEVLIAVRDDGKGLNRDRIRAKAEAMGKLAADAEIGDADLYEMIFQPGFSTAAQVSGVSGRGVGMDVVKNAVEGLRGRVQVTSEPGTGCTITLRLPLTLAIIDGLLVEVAGQRYVVPFSAVDECVELSHEPAACNFLTLRDELVPFLRLRDVFETEGSRPATEMAVIVGVGEHRTGLVVDSLLGGHQTVVKSLGRLHRGVRCISGATILGDGRIALILDVMHLISLRQAQEDADRRHKESDGA